MTALVVVIEPDRTQAARLSDIVARQAGAELVMAGSARAALEALGTRVPDLILIPALLAARDEAAIGERLRELGPRAAHTQTVTVPRLGTAEGSPRRAGLLGRLRRNRPAEPIAEVCSPDVFAQQVAEYLQRAHADRNERHAGRAEDEGLAVCEPLAVCGAIEVREPIDIDEAVAVAFAEPRSEPEPEPVLRLATGPESELAPVFASARAPEPEPVLFVLAEPEPELALRPEPEPVVMLTADAEPEVGPVFESRIQPELEPVLPVLAELEPELALPPEPEPVVRLAADAEPEVAPAFEPWTEREPEPELALPPEPVVMLAADAEPAGAPVFASQTEPEPEPVLYVPAEREPEAAPVFEPPIEMFEPAIEPEPRSEPVLLVAAHPEPEPEFEPAPESDLELDREPTTFAGILAALDDDGDSTYLISPTELGDEDLAVLLEDLSKPAPAIAAAAPPPAPPPPPPQPRPPAVVRTAAPPPPRPQRARAETRRPLPVQDEWGLFDPAQCGFAALVAKLEAVTDEDEDTTPRGTSVRVVSYS